jgi:ribosomal protein S12 methylthiotransferase accessory factor
MIGAPWITKSELQEAARDEPHLYRLQFQSGNLSYLDAALDPSGSVLTRAITAMGVGHNKEAAEPSAWGEVFERLSVARFHACESMVATANELGSEAVSLESIPACSRREISHPACPISIPSKNTPIRWVRVINALTGISQYAPKIMMSLFEEQFDPGERFWLPTTSGCAAHTDPFEAASRALIELVERDALSITWLQRLALREILIDDPEILGSPEWKAYETCSSHIKFTLFEATTDLGIAVILGVQTSEYDHALATLVSCGAGLVPADVVRKVLRDMAAFRPAFRGVRDIPADWDQFSKPHHGAFFMADRARQGAFAFLRSRETVNLSALEKPLSTNEPVDKLRYILAQFNDQGINAYIGDISSSEARQNGYYVVRALVPQLQPLSFHYRARFLGNSRLYELPRRLGYQSNSEDMLNSWPLPFA